MNVFSLALGTIVLAIVFVDLLWTTLWVEGGAGPLTAAVMAGGWRVVRRAGERYPRARTLAGPLIVVVGLTTWIALLWIGWTLVFASAERAIVAATDPATPSWVDRLYFVGYAVFTLGNGDFVPRGEIWQVATVLTAGTGMLFITLSVTYLLSVLDAVTQKRAFASGVSGLGTSGAEVLRRGWDGEEFQGIEVPLDRLTGQLDTLTANHKAYPVLHYFHSAQTEQSPITSIAVLDDALLLFRYGVAERDRPSEVTLANARLSVRQYLRTLHGRFVDRADRRPPEPSLESLRESGIPTVPEEEFAGSIADFDDRRRTLFGLVESDSRRWPAEDP